MRVLHLFPRFRPNFAGDGLYFEKLWPQLSSGDGGHDVLVFTTPRPAEIPPVAPRGMNLIYLRRSETESAPAVLLRYYLWLLRNIRRYDIIHARTHIDRFFVSNWIARLAGVRFIYSATLDDSPPYILKTYRPNFWRFAAWAMRKTITRLVVLNRRLYDESAAFMAAPGHVVIVPQGVTVPERIGDDGATRDALGIPRDAFVQLYVGSISRRKDVLFLIENLAALNADRKPRYLVMLGPALEPDYRAELDVAIAALGVGDRVRFVGYRDDPAPFYRMADAFVFASWLEGFPNVLAEAMAYGLPIVARRLEGVTDFVLADGDTGLLFDTPAEYRALLHRVESDDALAERLGRNARAKAASDYSMAAVAKTYAALYRTVLTIA
ncbi:MAG: glycosyltransferase family 4 protein [Alphaproteobacteria bacterium]|nr:glycosyltransferase family 4 protein [Alphaproteobacteria bacterium]